MKRIRLNMATDFVETRATKTFPVTSGNLLVRDQNLPRDAGSLLVRDQNLPQRPPELCETSTKTFLTRKQAISNKFNHI
jgi:hypothetical protein